MPNRRMFNAFALLIVGCWLGNAVNAQSLEAEQIKSEIYFGSYIVPEQSVSEQAWEEFLSTVVRDLFPTGLTVIDALGKGTHTAGPLTPTRVVIVVHPAGADAEARLNEVKMKYKKRFGSAGIFQIDQIVRVRE